MTPRTPARWFLLLVILLLIAGVLSAPPAAANLPLVTTNPNASRTVTWAMNSSEGLSLTNVDLDNGHAELPWDPLNVTWSTPGDFVANGSLDPTLESTSSGIAMRVDGRNYVSNPEFASSSGWTYTSGSQEKLNATWDSVAENGRFNYSAPSTQRIWDSMDSMANWTYRSAAGVIGGSSENTTTKQEGAGSAEIEVTFPDGAGLYAGLSLTPSRTVNWSIVDELVLWVYLNQSAPLVFNVSAVDANQVTNYSSPTVLASGWNEIAVDLRELGSNRDILSFVSLLVWGSDIPARTILFDVIRVGTAKRFTDTATIAQVVSKLNATTALPGSALLGLSWRVSNATNVEYRASIALDGPSGPVEFAWGGQLGDGTLTVDVSSAAASIGSYTVRIAAAVQSNTTAPTNVSMSVDDVRLFFPNRQNGTYSSGAIPLGIESEFLRIASSATLPPSTEIRLSLRTGNTSNPGSAGWSDWQARPSNGSYSLQLPGARYVQIRADLNTTNASLSPALASLTLLTRHRVAQGIILSVVFTAAADFLRWQTIAADWNGSASASVTFLIGDGSYFEPVALGGNLSAYTNRAIRWQAILRTGDGLQTPSLLQVRLIYEYLGPVVRLGISTSVPVSNLKVGEWVVLLATAYDAGGHANGSGIVTWSTTDPAGSITNNDTRSGAYRPSTTGDFNITAVHQGSGFFATVRVHVEDASNGGSVPFPPLAWMLSPAFLLPVALAVAGGLGVYEFAIRRMFAVDDVFIISRDGRLMLHNTRRMRADRDEDVLSGMLTAMITFLRDWDPEENGSARRFDYGDKTALLEHGEHVFVAAVYAGRVPRWARKDLGRFVRDLESQFGSTFSQWTGSPQDLHGLRQFTEKFVSRLRYRRNGRAS